MDKVSLLRCNSYDLEKVEASLRKGFDLLGGDSFLKKIIPYNKKLMLKPNLLSIENKNSVVVTNPVVFEAAIRIFKDYTSSIYFGDSPGFGDSIKAAEKCGLMEVAKKYNVEFKPFKDSVHVTLEDSILVKSWTLAKDAYEADILISLPKLKTHAMAFYTGAIKNQFGCVPGTLKASWHTRMPQAENFSRMLLDLNKAVGTDFAILDGIIAMEGNGPKNGTPKKMDTIIMGESLTAIDSIATSLIGYEDPLEVPILKAAYETKSGSVLRKDIEVLGEKIDDMKVKDFKLSRKGGNFYFISPKVTSVMRNALAPDPFVLEDKCISCKRCYEVCPEKPKVISMVEKNNKIIPKWDMSKCIRCFCCQELCPVGAIDTKYKVIAKVLKMDKR
ncbi:MAG: DUF362 domain-containing protein [Clostridiaceae bacterium]